jgi:hypothetical protein
VLLVFGAPCQLPSLAGQEHGRTIPLADFHSAIGAPGSFAPQIGLYKALFLLKI